MRIFEWFIVALILGATPVVQPALAFEGTPVGPQDTAIPVVAAQPGAAAALKKAVPPSTTATSLTSLQYAAEGGHPVAYCRDVSEVGAVLGGTAFFRAAAAPGWAATTGIAVS